MIEEVNKTIEALKKGAVILYPTDTVWGLGCDATNEMACKKLSEIKQRDRSKSLIVLVNSIVMLEKYADSIPEAALQLVELADKPLTIVYPSAVNLSAQVAANDGSVGIRVTQHPFCNKLIEMFRKPIVSTSANLSGAKTPGCFAEISPEIIAKADYVVHYEQNLISRRKPSAIIKFHCDGSFNIIR